MKGKMYLLEEAELCDKECTENGVEKPSCRDEDRGQHRRGILSSLERTLAETSDSSHFKSKSRRACMKPLVNTNAQRRSCSFRASALARIAYLHTVHDLTFVVNKICVTITLRQYNSLRDRGDAESGMSLPPVLLPVMTQAQQHQRDSRILFLPGPRSLPGYHPQATSAKKASSCCAEK